MMRAGKLGLLIWIVNAMSSFSTFAQDPPVTKEGKKIAALISSLREVISANKMMLKHNGRPLLIFVDESNKDHRYYLVSVMEDLRETDHGFTIMRFGVNPETHSICYVDVSQGFKQIPLKIWREHGSKW